MCVIIFQKQGQTFPKEDFIQAAVTNKDGIGLAVWDTDSETNEPVVKIGRHLFNTPEQAWNYYDTYAAGKQAIIHLRFRTHGNTSLDNCHPFKIIGKSEGFTQDLYLMHNGIISNQKCEGDESDTAAFCRSLNKFMKQKQFTHITFTEKTRNLFERNVGKYNKLALFDSSGQYLLTGSWVDYKGFKCSNKSYFEKPVYKNTKSNSYSSLSFLTQKEKDNTLFYRFLRKITEFSKSNPVVKFTSTIMSYTPEEFATAPLCVVQHASKETMLKYMQDHPELAFELYHSVVKELAHLRKAYHYKDELPGQLRPDSYLEWSSIKNTVLDDLLTESKKKETVSCLQKQSLPSAVQESLLLPKTGTEK